MTVAIPYIPENAPFTEEQRAWLNGLLAGIFSNAPETVAAAKPARRIAVLYASQSGTAEGLARKLAKELKAHGHAPAVSTLVGYTPAALAAETCAIFLASTYGDGEAPDGVQPFYEQLCLEHFPRMDKLSYAVFALGDRHYEHFCKFGSDLDAKLTALGANRLADRVECDVDVEGSFSGWKASLISRLDDGFLPTSQKAPPATLELSCPETADPVPESVHSTALSFTRDHPLLASVLDKKSLTHSTSTKSTIHVAFSIEGTGLRYEVGDACGVIPTNDLNLVAELLQKLRFNGNEIVPSLKTGSTTLYHALAHERQITRLNRKVIEGYAARGRCSPFLDLLKSENRAALESYTYDRALIDLVVEYPGVVDDPSELIACLPKLTPRLYSISSSPAAHAGQIHTTVAVVRFTAHNRDRGGVCSTFFADRTAVADRLPIYIQPNKKFRLPSNPDAPMIMIGPGTGIAPFRGFLHERQALGHKGKNWLFFGERSAATDFLYREELESMQAGGHLTHLDTAFSRDNGHKVYVQDRMLQQAPQFWRWLQEGASVYVCGDASRMARDVHETLCRIAKEEGAMPDEAAENYVEALKEQHRYHRDVY